MKVKPLGQRVIIKPIEKKEERTESGIYLPETAQKNDNQGEVIAISEQIKEPSVKAGDKVLYEKYGAKEITDGKDKYIIIDIKDIIAKLE